MEPQGQFKKKNLVGISAQITDGISQRILGKTVSRIFEAILVGFVKTFSKEFRKKNSLEKVLKKILVEGKKFLRFWKCLEIKIQVKISPQKNFRGILAGRSDCSLKCQFDPFSNELISVFHHKFASVCKNVQY